MSKKTQKAAAVEVAKAPDNKRRNFLIGAGVGSVGAAAALVSGGAIKPAVEAPSTLEAEDKSKGYRETEHIRRYYSTTRL
ncbi:MAG TPA: hypothetical protein VL381_00460 [Rhodocyclaceae bacterium]|jgi:hypothetical protein|nr:hypothetical protein [Rhodocyclaceae bacterium]